MATSTTKRKLAAVSRETPENTRNNQSQSTLDPEMAQEYISQVSEEIEGRVTKKTLNWIQQDRVLYLGCLVKTWRISSEATSSDLFRSRSGNIQEQQLRKPGTHWGSFLRRSCPEVRFSSHHSGSLNSPEMEEYPHSHISVFNLGHIFNFLAVSNMGADTSVNEN